MRAISVAGAVVLVVLLTAINPVPAQDFTPVRPNCCAPQSCCCQMTVPTSGPVALATVVPAVTVEQSPLGLPVLTVFNPISCDDADRACPEAPLSSGNRLSLYALSHAFLI